MTAEIFDRGYRSYDGPRSGVNGAAKSVYVASLQRALGLRRAFRFKIVPILAIIIAYVPAVGFLTISLLLPPEFTEDSADYAGYYILTTISLTLLTAFVAPEVLSVDRRTGMLGLYMASALNKPIFLLAKAAALTTVLLLVTLMPIVFLLVGYTFVGSGPSGFGDTVTLVARIIGSGLLIAVFFTLIGMAVTTITNRQGFASAGVVMLAIGSAFFAGALYEGAGGPDWVQLVNVMAVPLDLISRVYDDAEGQLEGVSTLASVGAAALIIGICLAIIAWGYRRLEIVK